mmetsp:Transcript_17336/g.35538  ORF Transcript_17336/g.35538 Transcript_17336/m.35538 type:complete len:129 (-) Transcript_17336:35-421(-)|eukprot:CAMPEP_0183319462 /NCGR_PEP_ID=MMETSP0160_2-20130417/63737_1 /TAXON_ID=2839 ORGANISM="Odontella Sinensis, Strain Grunow 1884" /NCGR_SAMPLE_ID=MMETSP0160_2 /ASSEMBLY_ACC=CAM_ASM_000250 /LENGTH=128 /DNA_ID=CAMNT_0025485945 /DNA_START=231 /DNA_END=617 /DNA_ORIENTATION=-
MRQQEGGPLAPKASFSRHKKLLTDTILSERPYPPPSSHEAAGGRASCPKVIPAVAIQLPPDTLVEERPNPAFHHMRQWKEGPLNPKVAPQSVHTHQKPQWWEPYPPISSQETEEVRASCPKSGLKVTV